MGMTREEQIDWLCRLRADLNNGIISTPWNKEFIEALNKVLEQELCDDAISRQAAVRWVKTECNPYGKPTLDFESGKKVIKHLKQMPPVTPKPKIGHWIKYGIPRCGEQHYKCTSCGYYINFGQWGELYTKEFKYCPNCAARMIKSQESEGKE